MPQTLTKIRTNKSFNKLPLKIWIFFKYSTGVACLHQIFTLIQHVEWSGEKKSLPFGSAGATSVTVEQIIPANYAIQAIQIWINYLFNQ